MQVLQILEYDNDILQYINYDWVLINRMYVISVLVCNKASTVIDIAVFLILEDFNTDYNTVIPVISWEVCS